MIHTHKDTSERLNEDTLNTMLKLLLEIITIYY